MRDTYFATEAMGAIILLILLYANIFEIKQQTKKRNIFTNLLILNAIVVIADAVTWLDLGWKRMPVLFGVLIAMTYIIPLFIQATFARYIYIHISERAEISQRPFHVMVYSSLAAGIVSLVLCISGSLFVIRDGIWRSGPAESYYYLFYIVSLLLFSCLIFASRKKLGLHDLIASLSFCFVPLISIFISSALGFSVTVPFMAIDILVIYIMLQAERENNLLYQSNTDELTGLYNRRAYEESILQHPAVPPEADYVYASIDINGLKQVNDTLGHAAGDELICGAAHCLKRTLGNYGRIYRTGGDEFVAVFYADEARLKFLMEDLDAVTDVWCGHLVDSLSLSVGCAAKREFAAETIDEISHIADKRMYEAKERHYANKGIDRRGQSEAYKVLCSLYTKILKINITNDSFSIVRMNEAEHTKEMGYSERISEWLADFGTSGRVHPDDLQEYLAKTNIEYIRDYFTRSKTSLAISYRRKYDDGFKRVMMEIIPANDYSDKNQSLFLYVKNIDV